MCRKKTPADEIPCLDYKLNLANESGLRKKYNIYLRKEAYLCLDYPLWLKIEDAVEHLQTQQLLNSRATGMTSSSASVHLQHIQVGKRRRGAPSGFERTKTKVTERKKDGRSKSGIRRTIMKPNQALNKCRWDRHGTTATNQTPLVCPRQLNNRANLHQPPRKQLLVTLIVCLGPWIRTPNSEWSREVQVEVWDLEEAYTHSEVSCAWSNSAQMTTCCRTKSFSTIDHTKAQTQNCELIALGLQHPTFTEHTLLDYNLQRENGLYHRCRLHGNHIAQRKSTPDWVPGSSGNPQVPTKLPVGMRISNWLRNDQLQVTHHTLTESTHYPW